MNRTKQKSLKIMGIRFQRCISSKNNQFSKFNKNHYLTIPMRLTREKLPSKRLSYKNRFLRLTSKDAIKLNKYKRLSFLLLMCLKLEGEDGENKESITLLTLLCLLKFKSIKTIRAEDVTGAIMDKSRMRTVDSFTDSDCSINFRFLKEDLKHLIRLLKFPERVTFKYGHSFSGEEVFIRGLYEMVTADNQHRMCRNVFGGQQPQQSMCFNFFTDFIHDNWKHLVQDNLNWWYKTGWFARSANYIRLKMGTDFNNVAFFIDCNCLPTSVVGGGPTEDGANSARWDKLVQQSFYNEWKSIHGLKHQTVNNCLGMVVDIHGPTSLRLNDLNLLNKSEINDRMRDVQTAEEDDFDIMGDSAYMEQSNIRSYYRTKRSFYRGNNDEGA